MYSVFMARTREFEPDEILDAALELFWRKGYAGCSMADVVEKSGVARYGLYQSFKDKDQLYCAALKHYHHRIRKTLIEPFCNTEKKADYNTLVGIFHLMVEHLDKDLKEGCFVHQAALERGGQDEEVDSIVRSFFAEIKEGYRITISNGIELGQIRALPVDDLVTYVMGIQRAVVAMTKQQCSLQERKNYVRCALALLEP